jgi:hypothetical protein
MGWQWIAYAFYDAAPPDDQLWLLPDGQSVARLTPGEWTYYLEEPEVYPEGCPFPLEHKDNRILPAWIPDYTTSMDGCWAIVQHVRQHFIYSKRRRFWEEAQRIISARIKMKNGLVAWPDAIFFLESDIPALAALRVLGVEIED